MVIDELMSLSEKEEDKIKLAIGSSQQQQNGSSDRVSLSQGTPCHIILSLLKVYRS